MCGDFCSSLREVPGSERGFRVGRDEEGSVFP